MKYETPELTALASAISVVQTVQLDKTINTAEETPHDGSDIPAYCDWE